MNLFVEGFALQAGLILGLGAQNIFVLDCGIRRNHHNLIAAVCSLCDFLLILLGVLGAASVFIAVPILKIIFGVLGVSFLAYYALKKLLEAYRNKFDQQHSLEKKFSAQRAIILSLGFSLLNPHVYLDTVILIGGYASKYEALDARLYFGLGASIFSVLWFFSLANLSAYLGPVLTKPKAMRIVSLCAGIVLSILSYKLSREVLSWL